jgi:hypothetical protein
MAGRTTTEPQQSRVAELFGVSTQADRSSDEWAQIVADQNCPFSSKRCFKVRKSNPEVSIGTCVVRAGKEYEPRIICPNRLLEDGRVFADVLHLMTDGGSANEHHVVPEVQIPGGSVDYFVVAAADGVPVDFVGVEFQALDTSGTVWPARQEFLEGVGAIGADEVPTANTFGINWKMTAKTILLQLHHKVRTFELVDRKLVLVLQQELMDYMASQFSFDHLAHGSEDDSLHFHPYRLAESDGSLSLAPGTKRSTDADGIARALELGEDEHPDAEALFGRLRGKLGEGTRWEPGGGVEPPPLADLSDD